MSVFKVGKTVGAYEHCGDLDVEVIGQVTQGKRDPYNVLLSHRSGGMHFSFSLTPDQSRDIRKLLEDAEAKAEILTAAI